MLQHPLNDCHNQRNESFTQRSQRVFNLRRKGGIDRALQDSNAFKTANGFRQHPLADSGKPALASMLVTEITPASLKRVAELAEAGEIEPFVRRVYPLSEVANAWRDIRTGQIESKVVFRVGAEAAKTTTSSS
jgi:NADPH:quinone reductase-like Zn-dependent oxidoreductase